MANCYQPCVAGRSAQFVLKIFGGLFQLIASCADCDALFRFGQGMGFIKEAVSHSPLCVQSQIRDFFVQDFLQSVPSALGVQLPVWHRASIGTKTYHAIAITARAMNVKNIG